MIQTVWLGEISINITAEAVAWYAAVIATFSAVKVIYDVLSDRHKIQLSYRTDVSIQGDGYDPDEKQFCIEVINTGKRTVKVVNVGFFTHDGMKSILSDSLFNLDKRVLTDSNPSTSYMAPLKDIDVEDVWYIYALDGRGKSHKKYIGRFARLRHIPVYFKRRKRARVEKRK